MKAEVETNYPATNLRIGDTVIDYDRFERQVVHVAHDVRNGTNYLVATMHTGSLWAYAQGVTVTVRLGALRAHQVECLTCDLVQTTPDRHTAALFVSEHADQGHTAFLEPTL